MENKILKMIPDTSDDRDKVLKEAGEGNLDHNSWWYLHGDLETMCHYDKATIYNMSEFPEDSYPETIKWRTLIGDRTSLLEFKTWRKSHLEGIYPVEVYGIEEECIGYFWITDERDCLASLENSPEITKEFRNWDQRGLVVLKSDLPGNEWAKSRYEERSSYL